LPMFFTVSPCAFACSYGFVGLPAVCALEARNGEFKLAVTSRCAHRSGLTAAFLAGLRSGANRSAASSHEQEDCFSGDAHHSHVWEG